ncbi:ORF2 [Simian torque teno virus 32]|uniref:ORF2 n=1 Tax=Simian torque teno virus 32 TaxID=1619220 RepID=A0A0C5IMV7_9VIRU|nr:ORF2 [Simian torque teno virus 32]AJP36572.1 ORF2 [Simian torque teno virus 32]
MFSFRRRRRVHGQTRQRPSLLSMFWKKSAEDAGAWEERWLRSVYDTHALFCSCNYFLGHLSAIQARHRGPRGQSRTPPTLDGLGPPSPPRLAAPPPTPASSRASTTPISLLHSGGSSSSSGVHTDSPWSTGGDGDAGGPGGDGAGQDGVDAFTAEQLEELFAAVEEDAR